MHERQLERGRRVVGGEVDQHRPGERVARRCARSPPRRWPARPRGASARRPPFRFSAASAASRRGPSPCGSNTNPERSMTAATLSVERRPAHLPDHRGEACARSGRSRAAPPPCARAGSRAPPAMRESWKAAWIRRCASAACRASTTTEMLSSERALGDGDDVDLRRRPARENTPPRCPACRACRGPTTATVAMPGLDLDAVDLAAARSRSRNSRVRLSRASSASALGHAEADRVLRRRLRDERDRDLPRVQRVRRCGPRCRARPACRCR